MNRSIDWLNQAKSDLSAAKNLLKSKDYAWCCFLAQQTGEKSLKAMAEKNNILLWGHDLVDLLKNLKKSIKIPQSIESNCNTLNLYYIATRYPDAFSSGFPSEKFSNSQAQQAIKLAEEVLNFAASEIN
ncbi:MAG: HEPN domain-containing protein [Promethearchaeota archaeon]|nr:MAG: HEPN domain-containing protein [Candidatus Lokiarchaeota archaeon]